MEKKVIEELDKSSLNLTYRSKKEGLEVTGFDVKVYGDNTLEIERKINELVKIGRGLYESENIKEIK